MEPGITAPATFFSTVRVGGDCVAARRPKESQAIVPARCMIASDRAASPVQQDTVDVVWRFASRIRSQGVRMALSGRSKVDEVTLIPVWGS